MKLFDRTKSNGGRQEVPFIVLDDLVCFPGLLVPLYLSAKAALKALDAALASDRTMFVANRLKDHEGLTLKDLAPIGTMVRVVQVMKLPNSTSRLLVEGIERVKLVDLVDLSVNPRVVVEELKLDNSVQPEIARLMRLSLETFQRYSGLHKKVTREVLSTIENAEAPHKLVDLVAGNVHIPYEKKIELLASEDAAFRLRELIVGLEAECELLDLKTDISGRVKKRMEQNQKEFFLNEQIKEMHRELGKDEDDVSGVKELEKRFAAKFLPEEVQTRVHGELKRLGRVQAMSPEAGILRTWLEWIADLSWDEPKHDNISLARAQAILDEDHYGLDEAKDRILDFMAARKVHNSLKAPILCFVGPPGTGKTSLGKSLARALDRRFLRISLGGVRDEAEIRGHRRTYVGAMPGKIIQNIRKAGTRNPVFVLDEIDKLSNDHRGDPSSALLEVLDPEQNYSFVDHYLELAFDLSQVMFIATANDASKIPAPLRDRMEVIEIPGYTRQDKLRIAEGFLVPRQLREHGLGETRLKISQESLRTLIDEYTMEAGLRNLDRLIAKVIRKVARQEFGELETGEGVSISEKVRELDRELSPDDIRTYLKHPRPRSAVVHDRAIAGLAYGLAWTESGGTVLPVEVRTSKGKGELLLTGSLGDVMKESARIALSLIRTDGSRFGITAEQLSGLDIHIHVPEGATPKEGPSAGITLCSALVSSLCDRPLLAGWAMTGEITLTGQVLPVGGIREKVLAAHRYGLKRLVLPAKNRFDAEELDAEILQELEIRYVSTFSEVLDCVLPSAIEAPIASPKRSKKAAQERSRSTVVDAAVHKDESPIQPLG